MLNHTPSSPTPRTALHETARTSRRRRRGLTRLSALASAAVLTWTIGGGSPVHSAPQRNTYVTLGDSYASGVGAPPYDDDGRKWAAGAYVHQVASQIGKLFDFGACAGARTKDFYQPGKEAVQLDHLSASTSLVTFSIGGNDAGFSTLFSKCITAVPFTTCSSSKKVPEQVDGVISALAGKAARVGITSYDMFVADITARTPGATVVAVGYPRMFTPQGAGQTLPVPGRCEDVTKADRRWINAKTNEINATAKVAAQRHGYRFADSSGSFAGYELCGKQSSWFDDLINDGRFHPNAVSHKAIAGSIMGALQEQPTTAQELPAAAQAQVDNTRSTGSFALVRNGDQLALDVSASTDSDGTIVNIDWHIQRADGPEEIPTRAQAAATAPADEQVSIIVVITDNQGKKDFTTQIVPVA